MRRLSPKDARFVGRVVWLNAALPALLLAYDYARGQLGVNPTEALTRTTGVLAIIFLCFTLAVTPFVNSTKQYLFAAQRRSFGLTAFYYALAHFATYLAFNRAWKWASIPADILKHPFILVGFLSWLAMVPLAVTSTNAMIKRMGAKNWKRLHRLTYPIAIGGVTHWALIVKSDLRWPILFAVVTGGLLALRPQFWPQRFFRSNPPRANSPKV